MKLSQKTIIIIALLVFFALGFVLRSFPFTKGNLDIAKPPVKTSFDVFENTGHTKWIYDTEQQKYLQPHKITGLWVINPMNSLFYIFIAGFSKFTNVSIYQTVYFATVLLSLLVVLAVFALVEKYFNERIALIAAALAFFPQAKWLFQMYIGFQYDYYAFLAIIATLFLFLHYIEKENRTTKDAVLYGLLFGALMAMIFLAHYIEFLFMPFFDVVGLWLLWKKKLSVKESVIIVFMIGIIMLPFVLYYYPLTLQGHLQGGLVGNVQGALINKELSGHPDYFPMPRLSTALNVLGLLGAGIMFFRWKKISFGQKIVLLFIVYAILLGTSNYTLNVTGNRAERQLFSSYPIIVLLPAIGIYSIASLLLKRFPETTKTLGFIAIAFFIAFLAFKPAFSELEQVSNSGGFFDDSKWDALVYIRDTTPKDSLVFYLSGYEHAFAQFGERPSFGGNIGFGNTKENIIKLCNGQYLENYEGGWDIRDINPNGYILKRKGLNSFELVQPFYNHSYYTYNHTNAPLKLFDYVVLQYKNTGFDPCMAFFLNESIARGNQVVWNNNEMAVVKVKK